MLKILALLSAMFIAILIALGQIEVSFIPVPLMMFALTTAGIVVGLSKI